MKLSNITKVETITSFIEGIIKKGDILLIEDTLSCDKGYYVARSYDKSKLVVQSLRNMSELKIEPQDADRYVMIKQRLVDENMTEQQRVVDGYEKYLDNVARAIRESDRETEKKVCENKTDEFAKKIEEQIKKLFGDKVKVEMYV